MDQTGHLKQHTTTSLSEILQSDLQLSQTEAQNATMRASKLEATVEYQAATISDLRNQNYLLTNDLRQSEESRRLIEQQLHRAQHQPSNEVYLLQKQLDQTQAELQKAHIQLHDTTTRAQEEHKNQQQKIEELEQQLAESSTSITQLRKDKEAFEKQAQEVAELEATEIVRLESEISHYKDRYVSLQAEYSTGATAEQVQQMKEKQAHLEETIERQKHECDTLKTEHANQVDKLRHELKDNKDDNLKLVKEIENLRSNMTEMKAKSDTFEEQTHRIIASESEALTELSIAQSRIRELEHLLESQTDDVAAWAQSIRNDRDRDFEHLQKQIQEQINEKENLRYHLKDKCAALNNLIECIHSSLTPILNTVDHAYDQLIESNKSDRNQEATNKYGSEIDTQIFQSIKHVKRIPTVLKTLQKSCKELDTKYSAIFATSNEKIEKLVKRVTLIQSQCDDTVAMYTRTGLQYKQRIHDLTQQVEQQTQTKFSLESKLRSSHDEALDASKRVHQLEISLKEKRALLSDCTNALEEAHEHRRILTHSLASMSQHILAMASLCNIEYPRHLKTINQNSIPQLYHRTLESIAKKVRKHLKSLVHDDRRGLVANGTVSQLELSCDRLGMILRDTSQLIESCEFLSQNLISSGYTDHQLHDLYDTNKNLVLKIQRLGTDMRALYETLLSHN